MVSSLFVTVVSLLLLSQTTFAAKRKDSPTEPGEIQHIQWINGTIIDPYAVQIGLPPDLTTNFKQYVDESGITDLLQQLFLGESSSSKFKTIEAGKTKFSKPIQPLEFEESKVINLSGGQQWFLQRAPENWNTDQYWLSTNNELTQDVILTILGQSGFDIVLDSIGKFFDLEGIDVYSVGLIGETSCELGFLRSDFENTDGSVFNVMIPLDFVDVSETNPKKNQDILLQQRKDERILNLNYEPNVGLAIGDDTVYATGKCNYNEDHPGKIRLTMSIYLGDINEDNVDAIIDDLTDPFPPSEPDYLLENWGRHWQLDDPSIQLPKEFPDNIVLGGEAEIDVVEEGKDDVKEKKREGSILDLDIVIEQLAMMVNSMESATDGEKNTEEKVIEKLRDTIRMYDEQQEGKK